MESMMKFKESMQSMQSTLSPLRARLSSHPGVPRGPSARRTTRRLVVTLFLIALVPCQSGCLIFGRRQLEDRLDPAAVGEIEVGMSKAQVTQALGAPKEIIFSNKELDPLVEHAYVYEHETSHYTGISLALINFGNATTKRDRVVIFFTPDGLVSGVGTTLAAKNSGFGFPFGK